MNTAFEMIVNGDLHVAIITGNGAYTVEVTHAVGFPFPTTVGVFATLEAAKDYIANISYKSLISA